MSARHIAPYLLVAVAASAGAALADRDPSVVRYHMRLHFDDLRTIEQHLVAGRLKEAKALAFMIAIPEADRGQLPWADKTQALVDLATKLSSANSIDEALRLEVGVAVACANCHREATRAPIFPMPGRPPLSDHASSTVRMTRHRWATDRLWEGLVSNSEDHWRAGLAVLSETPLPYSTAPKAPVWASSLQKRANQALRDAPADTVEERGRMYGEMLVTCAACHSAVKRK